MESSFDWRNLPTNDYVKYIASLREIGCPDKTIQEIIIADIEERFRQEAMDVLAAQKFWVTGSQTFDASRSLRARLLEIDRKKSQLVEQLLGLQWQQDAYLAWVFDPLAELKLGFLDERKAMAVLHAMNLLAERSAAMKKATGGILLPEQEMELERMIKEIESELGPANTEEINLRTLSEMVFPFGIPGGEVSGAELRQIVKLNAKDFNAFRLLASLDGPPSFGISTGTMPNPTEDVVKGLLGDRRYMAYLRSMDVQFQISCVIARDFGLSQEKALEIYNLKENAEVQWQRLSSQVFNSPAERDQAYQAVSKSAESRVRSILGETAFTPYVGSAGAWWTNYSVH
jgi:hypothetical protein